MFLSLWHYLKGYVIVEICGGNIEKLLNLMAYHGIIIWKMQRKGTSVLFCISAADFKKIRSDVKKAKCKVRIFKKKGLPFITNKYKKRHMFVVGIIAFVMLIWGLTSFVWLIDIEGNERLSTMDVMHTLETHGYETGRLKKAMNLRNAETLLIDTYPELIWVGIHYEGTKMVVKVSESVLPPEMIPTEDTPTALCAKRDALITYIAVEKGKPMVKAGDIVKKGDLLVNGEMPLGEEQPALYYTSAKAQIKGKTIYSSTKEMTLNQVKKNYTDQISKKYSLNFFDKEVTFYSQKKLKGNYDVQHTRHQLHITKLFPLPFGLEIETQVGYVPQKYTLTEDEAKDLLLSWLWQDISSQLSDNALILKREAVFKASEGKVTGTLYIIAEEDISYKAGIEQKIQNEGDVTNEQN